MSFVSGGLTLSLAAVAHAANPIVVTHQAESGTVGEGGNNSSTTSTVNINEQSSTTTTVTNETEVQTNTSTQSTSSTSSSTKIVNKSDDSSGLGGAGHTELTGDNRPKDVSRTEDASLSGDKSANDTGVVNSPSSPSTPVVAEPAVQIQLHAQQALPSAQTATIRQVSKVFNPAVPVTNTPAGPTSPAAPETPVQDLPIQGALAGLSGVLSNSLLTLKNLFGGLLTGDRKTPVSSLVVLVSAIVLLCAVIVGRFVDRLKASGYSHAARADASSFLSSFATQLRVSLSLAYVPRYELAFFGVRNKVLNVPNL